jgi:hypothetical protein
MPDRPKGGPSRADLFDDAISELRMALATEVGAV